MYLFVRLIFAVSLLMTAVSACGELPRPFKTRELEDRQNNQLLAIRAGRGIQIAPVEGAPDQAFEVKLTDGLVKSLHKRDVLAQTDQAAKTAFVLSGFLSFRDDNISYVWVLRDRNNATWGKGVAQSPASYIDWLGGSERVIATLMDRAGLDIATAIKPETAEAAQKASNMREAQVTVTQVTGAPGDGNLSLVRSLRGHLRNGGIPYSDDSSLAAVHISGQVTLVPVDKNSDQITLLWIFSSPDGRELARIDQTNRIPHGALDDRWGDAAYDATFALIEAVRQTLNQLHQNQTLSN